MIDQFVLLWVTGTERNRMVRQAKAKFGESTRNELGRYT